MPELGDRRVIESIPVEVRRSRRRRTRIGLAFDPGGYVIMEAPLNASEAEIYSVVYEHQRWLRHRLEQVAASTSLSAGLTYASGEILHYLGDGFELAVRHGSRDCVRLIRHAGRQLPLFHGGMRGEIRVTLKSSALPPGPGKGRAPEARPRVRRPSERLPADSRPLEERTRSVINDWYRRRAELQFGRQLEQWQQTLPWLSGRMPVWRQRFMRSQWGSCSASGRISLNTHLIKTPERLIDYVLLHELCHLQHHDHSRRFYGLMTRYMPDWQERRGELDRYLPVLLHE